MDFGWAIIQLKNGEKVKRTSWNNNDHCLYIERAMIHQLNCRTGKVYCTSLDLSDFDANDWELFKEGFIMDFKWAVKQMKDGKKVRRGCWGDKDQYCVWEGDNDTWGHFKDMQGDIIDYFTIEIFNAKDWELFEEPKTVKSVIMKSFITEIQREKMNRIPIDKITHRILDVFETKLKSNIIENLEEAKLI